jgi:hypothetical protein
MKLVMLRRLLLRSLLALLLLGGLFFGIAFLPGDVEGNYRGIASSCACDSITFISLHDGKMVTYNSAHAPASLDGRYSVSTDGSIEIFLTKLRAGEAEQLVMNAYPRFLLTKFVSLSDGDEYWCWKWPALGRTGEALAGQEITSMVLQKDGSLTRKVFDRDFNFLKAERKIGKNQWAEQGGDGDAEETF